MRIFLIFFSFSFSFSFGNKLASQNITRIRLFYAQEGTHTPVGVSCDPDSFISFLAEDGNVLTTCSDIFIAQFQKMYQRLLPGDSTMTVDPRIMTVVSYEENIPNDTIYWGEYFGINRNGQIMQDCDSLLNLIKTKIGWSNYTQEVKEAGVIIRLLSKGDNDILSLLIAHINEVIIVALDDIPTTRTNSSLKAKEQFRSYINELSDAERAKFYEVFFKELYERIKPEASYIDVYE